MLPFMIDKKKNVAASSEPVQVRKSDDMEESEEYDSLQSAAEDLISGIHNKNAKLVKEALKAAFEMCESYPEKKEKE